MAVVKLLEWDTDFWGVRTGLADHPDASVWAEENGVHRMWLLVSASDPEKAQKAEACGWSFMDVRVKLERAVSSPFPVLANATREWREGDLPALVTLARSAHRNTRFYADRQLPRPRCDDLYEAWIRNSCSGWARHVFVHDHGGYVTVHADGDMGSIGLIAVPEEARSSGVGSELVARALSWAHGVGLQGMTVVTQGRNVGAQRLFHRCGFMAHSTDLWFHKRFGDVA